MWVIDIPSVLKVNNNIKKIHFSLTQFYILQFKCKLKIMSNGEKNKSKPTVSLLHKALALGGIF